MDDGTARIAALAVLALASLIAWRGLGWLALALAADFALRAAGRPDLSPVARAAGLVRRLAGMAPRWINAGPKRFAAVFGTLFSVGAGLALLAGHRALGTGLAATLAACAGLEGLFGFCVACRLHPWLVRLSSRPASEPAGLS